MPSSVRDQAINRTEMASYLGNDQDVQLAAVSNHGRSRRDHVLGQLFRLHQCLVKDLKEVVPIRASAGF